MDAYDKELVDNIIDYLKSEKKSAVITIRLSQEQIKFLNDNGINHSTTEKGRDKLTLK